MSLCRSLRPAARLTVFGATMRANGPQRMFYALSIQRQQTSSGMLEPSAIVHPGHCRHFRPGNSTEPKTEPTKKMGMFDLMKMYGPLGVAVSTVSYTSCLLGTGLGIAAVGTQKIVDVVEKIPYVGESLQGYIASIPLEYMHVGLSILGAEVIFPFTIPLVIMVTVKLGAKQKTG